MKYLQIYEAFESSAISKVIKFLKNKNIKDLKNFTDTLRHIQKNTEYPLNKIQDKDIKYLKKDKALKIRSDKNVENRWGIYCIKFWFSLDKGYLGHTITGNLTYSYNKKGENMPFTDEELNYIKDKLEVITGVIEPVNNYEDLQTEDKVIGIFNEYEHLLYLDMATIIREGNYLYAIQSVNAGNSPDYDNWEKYGPYSWSLGSVLGKGNDHRKLHFFKESKEPLHYADINKNIIENYLDYNLPMELRNFNIKFWDNYDRYIINELYFDENKLKESDFAIILMFDDMIKSEFKSIKQTSNERTEAKKGALKLQENRIIKATNIKKYLTQIISKIVDKASFDKISNLKKIILNESCGEYIMYYIMSPDSTLFYNTDKASITLYRLLKGETKTDYAIENLINIYGDISHASSQRIRLYKKSLNYTSQTKGDSKIALDIFDSISKKLNKYIINQNIETLEDLRIIMLNISNIKELFFKREFDINSYFYEMIENFTRSSDMTYYIKNLEQASEEGKLKSTIRSLNRLERYVDNLLKSSI